MPIGETLATGAAALADFFLSLPEKIRERMRLKARRDLEEGLNVLKDAQKEAEEIEARAKTEGH